MRIHPVPVVRWATAVLLISMPLGCDSGHASPASPPPPPPPAFTTAAGPTIAPGETMVFTSADGGSTACAGLLDNPINLPPPPSSEINCFLPRYGVLPVFNNNDPATNFVKVTANGDPVGAIIPAHAASAVYNDFTVEGSRNTLVDAQIAVTFDYVGKIAGASVYRDELSLSLRVEDVTAGLPVGSLSLFDQGRDGDQGVTDVSGTAEIVPVDDESNGFLVQLRRGHSYRVWFQLEASNFGAGAVGGEAQWSTIVVSIDEDEAGFQEEILEELAAVRRGNCEIIRLLHTPQGQRHSEIDVCEGSPGWPYDWGQ